MRSQSRRADLAGVVLTGASSDIGIVLSERLARRDNLRLLLTSNSHPCPSTIASQDDVHAEEGIDLTDVSDIGRVCKVADALFDGPFGVVHCVGGFWHHKQITDCSLDEARSLVASHYLTLYGLLNGLLPLMAKRNGGRIVAFSCTSVGFNYPEMAAFSSAKAAVECLVKCTANEWSRYGIAANAIALSTIATPKVLASKPLASVETYLSPADIAELVEDVLFSSSPYLSGNVLRPLKYSETFYNRAYFERNPSSASLTEVG